MGYELINMLDRLSTEFNQNNGKLFFNSVFGGGAYTFLLNLSQSTPLLIIDTRNNYKETNCLQIGYLYHGNSHSFIVNDFKDIISEFQINEININHLIWSYNLVDYINYILQNQEKFRLELNIYLHDFYSVCPSINLLNYKKSFCGVPDELSCSNCLSKYDNPLNKLTGNEAEVNNTRTLHNNEIEKWRGIWDKLFFMANKIIAPSQSAVDIWLTAFPNYKVKTHILQHDLKYLKDIKPHPQQPLNRFFQVYIIGDLGEHKGSLIVNDILELVLIYKLPICINVCGHYQNDKFNGTPFLRVHGRFSHASIANMLNNKQINCFIMTSICPETFSYVIQEMIMTNLPIICFNLGAQGQFVGAYNHGVLVDKVDARLMFKEIVRLYGKHCNSFYSIDGEIDEKFIKIIRENELLAIENEQLLIANENLHVENTNIKVKHEETKTTLSNKSFEITSLYSSYSWRVTKPLRQLMQMIRKLLYK